MLNLFIGLALGANPYAADPPAPIGVETQPFSWTGPKVATSTIELVLHVPKGFAVYRDGIAITVVDGDVVLGAPVFPAPELSVDPADPTQTRALYRDEVRVIVPIEKGAGPTVLSLTHQGCREGLCWPSTTSEHPLEVLP